MFIVPDRVGTLRMAALVKVGWQIAVHVADRRADYAAVAALAAVEDRPHMLVRGTVEPNVVLDRIGALDCLVIAVEHVFEADLAFVDRALDGGLDLAAG